MHDRRRRWARGKAAASEVFPKHYGTCAAGLLEAEVVTADGKIRVANAVHESRPVLRHSKRRRGTFGVLTKVTLRVRELSRVRGRRDFPGEGCFG